MKIKSKKESRDTDGIENKGKRKGRQDIQTRQIGRTQSKQKKRLILKNRIELSILKRQGRRIRKQTKFKV